jgi:N-acetylmuramoyl-L-alanine amidase
VARRANQIVWLRFTALCVAVLCCLPPSVGIGAESDSSGAAQPAVASGAAVASGVRIAGDEQRTRFILDLDQKIDVRAFVLADPDRVILDVPQVNFQLPAGAGQTGRGLIKAFRYGLVLPGGSRIVFDLAGPARIESASVLEAANGQPARLVVELAAVDQATFRQSLKDETPALRPALADKSGSGDAVEAAGAAASSAPSDPRPVIVLDPGHGGIDNGTVARSGEAEKTLVLGFALALRDLIEKSGKFRVVMTRSDDTFIPLADRVRIARNEKAALFVSIHADALPRKEGDAQGATVYTLSDKASDAEAERLAEAENRADAIGGVNLTDEPTDVADILIDLAQRETRTFSSRFARLLVDDLKGVTRLHKHPLKSAGFRVLKAPDVPSVLVELGYVSNHDDLQHLVSDGWRSRTADSVGRAIETFLGKRLVSSGAAN